MSDLASNVYGPGHAEDRFVPVCWHHDRCPWHRQGRCLFGHKEPPRGANPPWSRVDALEEDVQILRQAVRKLSAAFMWRNGQVRSGGVPAEREEQGAAQSGGEVALPTHAAPRPCTSEVSPTEMHHQRVEQACPGDNVALNIESLDKNYTPDFALAGRLEQGVVKPGGEVVSLPIHTASSPSTKKLLTVENASSTT